MVVSMRYRCRLYDTEAGEAVIKFASRAEADERAATPQVHTKL